MPSFLSLLFSALFLQGVSRKVNKDSSVIMMHLEVVSRRTCLEVIPSIRVQLKRLFHGILNRRVDEVFFLGFPHVSTLLRIFPRVDGEGVAGIKK